MGAALVIFSLPVVGLWVSFTLLLIFTAGLEASFEFCKRREDEDEPKS